MERDPPSQDLRVKAGIMSPPARLTRADRIIAALSTPVTYLLVQSLFRLLPKAWQLPAILSITASVALPLGGALLFVKVMRALGKMPPPRPVVDLRNTAAVLRKD